MPFDFNPWTGAARAPRPSAPTALWPQRERSQLIVDPWRVMLADNQGNLLGLPDPVPLQRKAFASRTAGRDL